MCFQHNYTQIIYHTSLQCDPQALSSPSPGSQPSAEGSSRLAANLLWSAAAHVAIRMHTAAGGTAGIYFAFCIIHQNYRAQMNEESETHGLVLTVLHKELALLK